MGQSSKHWPVVFPLVVFACVIFLYFVFGFSWRWFWFEYGVVNPSVKAAEYGDSFGFVNSLFSALAFAGVIVALVLQSQERRDAIRFHSELASQQFLTSLAGAAATLDSMKVLREDSKDHLSKNELTIIRSKLFLREMIIAFVELIHEGSDINEAVRDLHNCQRLRDADASIDAFLSSTMYVMVARQSSTKIMKEPDAKPSDFKSVIEDLEQCVSSKLNSTSEHNYQVVQFWKHLQDLIVIAREPILEFDATADVDHCVSRLCDSMQSLIDRLLN